jgi:cytochrome b561
MQAKRYHPVLTTMHWLLAVLLIALLAGGSFSLKALPNSSPEKIDLLRMHMLLGGGILVLMVLRLVVRLTTTHPPAASTGNALLDKLAPWVHWILYALVFAMAGSGIATAALAGLPDTVFSGTGSLPTNFDAYPPRAVHGIVAKLLMLTIGLHAAAALYHQFVKRDGLLTRMWWGTRY